SAPLPIIASYLAAASVFIAASVFCPLGSEAMYAAAATNSSVMCSLVLESWPILKRNCSAALRSGARSAAEQFRFNIGQLSKTKEHITDEFVAAGAYMASLPNGQKTDAAMKTDAAGRYEAMIGQGAEEMRGWIKEGQLQTPTLLYWGKND